MQTQPKQQVSALKQLSIINLYESCLFSFYVSNCLPNRIRLSIGIICFHLSFEVSHVAGGCRVISFCAIRGELWYGDSRQNPDDRHNNQQLNQGKTFSVPKLV